jgi:hemolysin activation/secretion protein
VRLLAKVFVSCTLLANSAIAQTTPPDIGTTLREMQQQRPTPPPPPKSGLDIQQPAPSKADTNGGPQFTAEKITVTGATAFPAMRLEELVSKYAKRPTSLVELRQGAATITRFYRTHGYPLARAYVPSQSVRNGIVEIRVLEGRYGKLVIEDEAGVSASLVRRLMRHSASPHLIQSAPLEHDLLLVQELQGVVATATLRPGDEVGTADLIVHLTPTRTVRGSVDVDNFGNVYTGKWRAGLGFTGSNLAGFGDQLALKGVATDQHGVFYGRASYQVPVDVARVGAAVSRTQYTLGKQFSQLDATGNATVSSLYLQYPILRTLAASLDTQVAFSYGKLKDDIRTTSTTDPRTSREVTFTVSGNVRDDFLSGGMSAGSLSYVRGKLDMDESSALEIDRATAATSGNFDKLTYSVLRLQNLGVGFSLYLAVSGQRAGKNLDPSEKFSLGGPDAVRAYPQGDGVGDTGVLGTVELRYTTQMLLPYGSPELVAFLDEGHIDTNQDPFLQGNNSTTLRGAGVGLNLVMADGVRVRASWAWRVGESPAQSVADSASRGWIQLGMDL